MDYKEIDKMRGVYYTNTPLYYKVGNNFVLYKNSGETLSWDRVNKGDVPQKLYIKESDLRKSTEELFSKLENKLLTAKEVGDREVVKVTEEIIDNIFTSVDEDSMSFATKLIKDISKEIITDDSIAREFLKHVKHDNGLVRHSTRVFFFSLVYCYYTGKTESKLVLTSLVALFHGIGKTKLPKDIIEKVELSDKEFEQYKTYPEASYKILKKSKNKEVQSISDYVLKHKENENNTGFPYGITIRDEVMEITGIMDDFEQLTSKHKMNMFEALKLIKEDVEKGKYNPNIFDNFVKSLGGAS